jgi:LuxR family maltose regulon positive regulatory protein
LLRDFLSSRLTRQSSPEEVATLHRRASRWYHDHGFIEDAIRHAINAGQMDEAVRLVAAHRHELLNEERWQRLTSWLGMFPKQVVHESPDLLLIKAWLAHTSQFDIRALKQLTDEIDALIRRLDLDPGRAQRLVAENDVLRAIPHYYALGADAALAYCRQGLENLPLSYYTLRSYAYIYATGALFILGDMDGANKISQDGLHEDLSYVETPRARNAMGTGFFRWMEADLDGVQRAAKFMQATSMGGKLRNSVGWANYFTACVHYQRNDLAGAEYHAGQLFDQRYMNPAIANVHGAFLLALVHQARNDRDAADEIMDRATTFVFDLRSQSLLFLVQAFQAELDIMRGEIDKAVRWLAQLSPIPPSPMPFFYTPQLTVPKALLAVNDPAHTAKLADCLRRLRELCESTHNRRFLIEVLALESLYYDSLGDETSAVEALRRSLSLARPSGFIRLFVDLGPRMKSALNRLPDGREMTDYVARILAAYSPGRSVSPSPHPVQRATIEPLTLRENEILELLAKRLSNKEIAQMLVISPVTVKRHTINIYQKLYVQNRRDAVLAAQELGLLD